MNKKKWSKKTLYCFIVGCILIIIAACLFISEDNKRISHILFFWGLCQHLLALIFYFIDKKRIID